MTDLPATVYRPDWVSPKEAAAYCGVSKLTILNWLREGRMNYTRLGYRTIRISMASVEKMMEVNKQER